MRVRPDDVRVEKRRPLTLADVGHGLGRRFVARRKIRAVTFENHQVRETAEQARDVSARGLNVHGN